jgi:hypothetical protein
LLPAALGLPIGAGVALSSRGAAPAPNAAPQSTDTVVDIFAGLPEEEP